MIPLRDTIPSKTFPIVNVTIIVVNIIIFGFEFLMPESELTKFIFTYGFIPLNATQEGGLNNLFPLFTSMFLHGSWMHLFSNMLALFIFGDNIEDTMGHQGYLTFYVLGGVVAGLSHYWFSPLSAIPVVGASGAISAVLGAYLILFPHSKILTLIPLFVIFYTVEIPAAVYLIFWFVSQLFNGTMALTSDVASGGVAWWAHVGGFIAGFVLVWVFIVPLNYGYEDN
ncbi:MAG: hypothetical protein B6242_01540 [Anaerolineaceae bacterium 4572_78]|nr:MAG: hypothetical protein B6242_01540 [Anaerolineaceae bacterium 4572_78]